MATFAEILARSNSPLAAAVLLVISWIACSDGSISDEEMAGIRSITEKDLSEPELRLIIQLARIGRIEDLQLALELLRTIDAKHRRSVLQMTVGMALEDGILTIAEGHVLRLVADVLSQSPSDLDSIFREMTGEAFPPPGDLSSPEWWQDRERQSQQGHGRQANGDARSAESPNSGAPPSLERLRDLGVLGLDEQATMSQVKEAYRRMVQIHHPDKFVTLGPDAVKAAEMTFRRIRSAYERLVRD